MPDGRPSVAVLASGGGTNLQSLVDAAADPSFPAQIALVVSNVPDAYCLTRARLAGIPASVIEHRRFETRADFETEIDLTLRQAGIDFICLAGFMRILTPPFVQAWHDRMLNVHPSLLPKYKGLDTHRRALEAGDDIHGCTVHLVRAELDDGPALVQAEVPVLPGDTPDVLAQRVLTREHAIYPLALALLAAGRVEAADGEARIDGAPGPVRVKWDNAGTDAD